MKIHDLFPQPVFSTRLNRKLNDSEQNRLKNCEREHLGNFIQSKDLQILEHKDLEQLKTDLGESLDYFLYNELLLDRQNSWTADTSYVRIFESGCYENAHRHTNHSFVLEFVVSARPGDAIEFHGPILYQDAPVLEFTARNSSSWTIPVESLDILIFPSSLAHNWSMCQHVYRRTILSVQIRPCSPFRTNWSVDMRHA